MKRLILFCIFVFVSSTFSNPNNNKKHIYLIAGSASPSSGEYFDTFYDDAIQFSPRIGMSLSKSFEVLTEFSYLQFPWDESYPSYIGGDVRVYQFGFGPKINLANKRANSIIPFLTGTVGLAVVTSLEHTNEYYGISRGQSDKCMYYTLGAGLEISFIILQVQSHTVLNSTWSFRDEADNQTFTVVSLGVSIG